MPTKKDKTWVIPANSIKEGESFVFDTASDFTVSFKLENKNYCMDIVEGNKLIAEFMGGKVKYYNISNEPYYQMPDKTQWMPQRLVYHSSWDWLMNVIEKIGSIVFYGDGWANSYSYAEVFNKIAQISKRPVLISSIESMWQAVVDFIQWYNTNQSKVNV